RQIADYIASHSSAAPSEKTTELIFDEGIVHNALELKAYLQTLAPSLIATADVRSARSHEHAVIQLADILAGFNRRATDIILRGTNKEITLWDDALDSDTQIDLLSYISIALRWTMWGNVPAAPDLTNIAFTANWPFKEVGGYGLR